MRKLLVLLLIVSFIATACAVPAGTEDGTAETPVPEEEVAPPDEPTGTLVVASAEQPEFLDPTMSLQILNWYISLTMYDPLVRIDDEGDIVPMLAESWEQLSPTAWQFNLREDVQFHDGEPFTSEDVAATLDHITDPDVGARQSAIWGLYDRTETPDEQTAVIHTSEPMGTLLTSLALTAIIPAHAVDEIDEQAIGTGPFQFVEWIRDDRFVVEANPDYWGGAPYLEELVFRTIPELSTRISALEQGEVDIVDIVPPEEFERLAAEGIDLVNQPTTYLRFMWLNTEIEPLDDVRVRQAINLAINREEIIDELFGETAYEATGCVAPGVIGYAEMPPLEYDLEEARSLMEEAGQADGFTMELKTAEYLAKQRELAQVIASYLEEININVDINVQDQALWVEDLLALNWESELIGTGTLTGDADYTLRRLYHSESERITYQNDELDALLIEQVGETDPEARQELLRQVCEILWEDVPIIFLFGTVQTYGVDPRVQNFETDPSQFLYFDEVWVVEE